MNRKFFHKNKNLQFIKVPIISKYKQSKIIPFRNIDCLLPSCIYEIDELLELYAKMLYDVNETFRCRFCKEMIYLDNFYRDETLEEAIDKIWVKYNIEKIQANAMIFYKNGFWEPDLSENLKRKLKKQGKYRSRYTQLALDNDRRKNGYLLRKT